MNPDVLAIAIRALAFICLYQAAGAAFFVALISGLSPLGSARACRLGVVAATCGIVLVLLLPVLEAARMAGDLSGIHNSVLLRLAVKSTRGDSHVMQAAGLVLVAVGLHFHGASNAAIWTRLLAVTGALAVAAALTLTGHTSVNPMRVWLVPLLGVHLIIVAFWFGGLWPLLLTLRHETVTTAAAVTRRFSNVALWLVPWIALAGIAIACILIESWSTFEQPYGVIIIAKALAFALLMALAARNRWRYTPALEGSASEVMAAQRGLRRTIVAEYVLIAGVLVLTAVLTSLYSPEN